MGNCSNKPKKQISNKNSQNLSNNSSSTADSQIYYHGTSVQSAQSIAKIGFKPSKTGQYGPGVYIGSKQVASGYCKGAMVELRLKNENSKRNAFTDAWVVKDPKQIEVVKWYPSQRYAY